MIDAGKIVFQGPVEGLLDAQRSTLVATPEHAGDVQALRALKAGATGYL